ncbi:hypothetical protein M2132_000239 [Dysgonomonas sp. PH5-45]|uniref:beta-1,6-N-acetylglucosaminyltransferase n=1 Tax=unclassified Dysgonomonas TaxID=2630389 RepID=UPI0024735B32|nr:MULTISPECIES: beta-1,6-N-acetylglucosaminyltransferase [unclassified Dysgonomonas]MDH6353919.1 hypothetical protein [Dysgonomonas sp. PH5-45]MDH6386821.1 hypothetical protein [Dysgonomonas sp. PH5-37]
MKTAILIHAHTDAHLLNRLVQRLQHPRADIYINLDAKTDILPFKEAVSGAIFLKKRVNVVWGRFSQVEQMLNSFSEVAQQGIEYSHILFISGQDYPVKPMGQIIDVLLQNRDKSYIDYHLLGNDDWSKNVKKRYQYWHFLPETDVRNNNFIRKILVKAGFKRRYPIRPVYYGACWMCLNMQAVEYILSYIEQNADFVRFNRYVGCADELFFQTILVNSPLRNSLSNNIHRYIDWSDKGKRPKTLTLDDLDNIKASDAWFARKVDTDVSASLLDELDKGGLL